MRFLKPLLAAAAVLTVAVPALASAEPYMDHGGGYSGFDRAGAPGDRDGGYRDGGYRDHGYRGDAFGGPGFRGDDFGPEGRDRGDFMRIHFWREHRLERERARWEWSHHHGYGYGYGYDRER